MERDHRLGRPNDAGKFHRAERGVDTGFAHLWHARAGDVHAYHHDSRRSWQRWHRHQDGSGASVSKLLPVLALWAGVVSCHLDKLLNSGNPPPSQAPPARVAFASSLVSARAGEPISPPVQVTVQDSTGRVTLRDTLVTLSLGANPSGDSLRGTKQVRSVNGVATFANLRLDKAASGYTLTAAAPKLEADTSAAFSVMPAPATELLFTVQPSRAMQDSAIKPPVQVTAYDSLGNNATNFTGSIHLGIGTDGSVSKKAKLSGSAAPAVAGVATFSALRIDSVGVGYTLTAAFGSATPIATSDTFSITPGPPPPPTHLGFTQQPQTTVVAGAAITPPVQVAAFDAAEHVVQGFTGAIGLALGPASNGGTLSGGAPVNAVNGIATFSSLKIDKAGNGYTLLATASQLTAATSSSFNVTAPPNQPPVAAFTSSCTQLVCSFTSTSSDPDGTIAGYRWTFGDGTAAATTQNPSHTYTAGGTFSVTLTVTDNQNATGSVSHPVTVTAPPPPNQPPVAAFTSSCTLLVCSFTSTSSDPDGTIARYAWTFGDGGTASTQNPSHTYTAGGTFTVTLTVTDNQSATGSVSHPVTVTAPPPPNQPPVAAFSSSCTQLTCNFTSTSSDPDGTIASYAWTFGDGGTASTQNPSHLYTAGGTYTVTLTVTDNQSATGSVSHPVTVTAPPPPNQPPVAAFTSTCTQLTCNFTSTSSDPDGTIASYAWTFGDGGTASTQNPSHPYTAGGTYTVTLTVTDNQNATGSVSHTVTVTAPPPPNQPPVVIAGGDQSVLIGALFNLQGASFSDPDHDGPWTVTIDWGDGSSPATFTAAEGSISRSHSYVTLVPATYTLTVTVQDAHGATGSASKTVQVVL